ncbi:sensor histidine kinase [Pelagibacterium halotolerans]|uniref:histidine kinase n=1 Tax=Pelagibacterium halotolerans (strain DSM 22347 / JCM 15775 / CGMCC 1.7692 / B2) TaxID=1082931 RepID=G4RCJ7_PELHB|nr:PAS domain-containing sensor histidine kinase [Pelagibacterium halotolerans]AEQ50669.1 multi-sensor signal transduction histidine kinase [Pelagibacterium halotolerans B2]QJR19397.1 PAS domain S-box protein [Pelagibacterium halotolerans]SDZ92591.1 two-component system, cell cycle sensor histidine kinase DivJ [Pelagibacterium halotolerans]
MRNPFADFAIASPLQTGAFPAGQRNGVLHRVLTLNTLVLVAGLGLAMALSLVMLFGGNVVPLIATAAVSGLVALSGALLLRGEMDPAIAVHAIVLGAIGAVVAAGDPSMIDLGLALGLMAALYGQVLSKSRHRYLIWTVPALILVASASDLAAVSLDVQGAMQSFALIALAIFAAIAVITATRLEIISAESPVSQTRAFAVLAENILGAVVRYGADGGPVFISRSAGNLLGCRTFELDGAGLFERVHVMDRPAYRKAISDASNGTGASTIELRLRRDDVEPGAGARYVWVEFALAPLRDDGGSSNEVLAVLRDISVRKNAEREVDAARRQAEDASEAKSRFLATIGHELRTPLNAIVGFSDMMSEGIGGNLSPTHAEYAGHISRSGHHLLDVVNMLLDMSKIEAGKFEVHAELFAPQALVEPCLQMVEKLARDSSITIEAAVPENLPQIMGDERACRQILINLLSNAIKFSHDGGVVTLAIKRQGRMLAMSVGDSGIGMRPETIERIGEPFLQAQDSLSRRYEGTGLGLSIVKGLVSLHGGRLDVVSEPGMGTTISVLLPLEGPLGAGKSSATIEHLYAPKRDRDEDKWLQDERRSAAK